MIRRAFREALLLCLLALPPAAWTGWRELKWRPQTPLAAGEVKLSDAQAWGPNALWVDARPSAKFARQHIPGAISLTPEEWEKQVEKFLNEWDPEKHIVVYGEIGGDSAPTVALRLREEFKIEKVWILHDGFDAWERR